MSTAVGSIGAMLRYEYRVPGFASYMRSFRMLASRLKYESRRVPLRCGRDRVPIAARLAVSLEAHRAVLALRPRGLR